MQLKEYLEENLDRFIQEKKVVNIGDIEFMRGVTLLTDSPAAEKQAILNDRPVKNYWDFNVVEIEESEEEVIIYVVQEPYSHDLRMAIDDLIEGNKPC